MLKNVLSALVGGVMVCVVMWAYWSDRLMLCQSEAVTLKAEHRAMAEKVVQYEQLFVDAAKRVDLSIPKATIIPGGSFRMTGKHDGCVWYETSTRRTVTCLNGYTQSDVITPIRQVRDVSVLKDPDQSIQEMTEKFKLSGLSWPVFKESIKESAKELGWKLATRGR